MNKLKSLNVYMSSLYKDEGVENLLKLNLSLLVDLNIGFTSVSGKNAIKIL